MQSVIYLIISMVLIFILIFKKFNSGIALLVGAFLYGILIHGFKVLNIMLEAFDLSMLNTVLTFILVIFITEVMRLKGATVKIVEGLNMLGARITAIIAPLVIGLLPMPGGAYVSAAITKPVFDKLNLRPEEETYINYWFRHVFTMTWPLVPGVIMVAGIIGTEPYLIARYTWPIPIASIVAGLILSLPMLRTSQTLRKDVRGLVYLWPVITIITLALLTRISMMYILILTSILYVMISRTSYREFKEAIKRALNPTIIMVVVVAFIFSKFIQISSVGTEMFSILKGLEAFISFLISFIIGIVIGIESVSMALCFSILATSVPAQVYIYAFLGVYVGHLLSPSHPCLVMTVEYYKSEYPKTYKYIVLSGILTMLLTIFLIILFYV
ncbi:MAG: DUF401 family protein [Nitrososphaerota archaeon]